MLDVVLLVMPPVTVRRRMPLRLTALVALPLLAFLIGPIVGSAGEGDGGTLTLSVLPTVLPALAVMAVAVYAYRSTGNAVAAAVLTLGSVVLACLGAILYLLAAWPTGG